MPLEPKLRRIAGLAAILVAALGLVVLIGWVLDVDSLRNLGAGWQPMKANTALCLLLAGASLWFQHERRYPKAGLYCASAVLIIAVLSFGAYLANLRLGIDELLASDPSPQAGLPPGRMSPHTAVGLITIALALLFLSRSRNPRHKPLSLWLAGLVVSLSSAVLFALAFQGAGDSQPILMGAPVAGALLVLSLGTVLARPDDLLVRMLFANNASGLLIRRLFLGVVLVPAVLSQLAITLLSNQGMSLDEGVLLLAVATMLSSFVLTLFSAENVANEADWRETSDRQRQHLTAQLQLQAANLQETVEQRTQELRAVNTSLRNAAESNARLALVANHTTYGVIITDADGCIQWANAAFEQLTGYRLSDIGGWKLGHFLQGADTDLASVDQLRGAVRRGESCTLEILNYTRGGQPCWHLLNLEPVHDESGNVINFVSIQTDVTEQRRARERLLMLNQRLELATRAADLGVWEWNSQTERFSWDERMLQIHGGSKATFSGEFEEWAQDLYPRDRARVLDAFKAILDGADEYDQAFRLIRRSDGSTRHLEARGIVQRDPAGRLLRITGTCRDVTVQKQVTEALRIAEERWQLAIEGTNDAVWDWNVETGLVYHDERWARMLGYDTSEIDPTMIGWRRLVHPGDLGANDLATDNHFAQRTPFYQHELRMRTKSGEWKWVLDRGKVVARAADGRPLRMAGTHTDITERKRLEQRLRQVEALALQVGQLAHIGGWELELEAQRLSGSEVVNRIFDLPESAQPTLEEALEFFLPEARAALRAALQQAETDATPFDLELPLVTAKTRDVWVRVLGTAEQRNGRTVRIQGAMQDVTARHESEESRRRLEAQLFQAQKMETLGTLAGGIAHDFNNLLTGIIGYHELAADSIPADHPAHGCLVHARNASLRARDLVAQILTFGRQSSTLEQGPVDLALVVEEARRFLRATLPANVTIEVEFAEDGPVVLGDATQLHQVILNLGSNAAHAMRPHGGILKIALGWAEISADTGPALRGAAPGRYAQLSVSDTGHGMTEATLRRIFDPFFTTKNTREGTGLGLAVVHGIVRAHRGVIDVRSEVDVGSTFHIYLPVTAEETQLHEVPFIAAPRGTKQFICVVDDEEFVGSCTKHALESKGYEAISYPSAEACLETLTENGGRYDLLLTDQSMPGMQGIDLAAHVRKLFPALPVVIMSGYFSKISPQALDRLGPVELLAKPFTSDELAAAVHRAMQSVKQEVV